MTRRRKPAGTIVHVPLGDGRFSFGRTLKSPLVEFFDLRRTDRADIPGLDEFTRSAVVLRVCVMHAAVNRWKAVGELPLSDEELNAVYHFGHQDSISGALSIRWTDLAGAYGEEPATLEECLELEVDAVWSGHHVEEHLRDHADGRTNAMTERFKPRDPAEWRSGRATDGR